ncbi:MAG: HAD-IA family hydrolase [Gammaproteobacteria bacterium]|nr:HAD-IA family hydrolase [Gammaproteobacteria bacterium]
MLIPTANHKATLIFDFDGTLADSLQTAITVINRLAKMYDFCAIHPLELTSLREKSALEIVRHLQIPILKVPLIAQKARQMMRSEQQKIRPINGIPIILHTLKSRGRTLGLLSSNSEENLRLFNQYHKLELFDFISGTSPLWGKAQHLKRLLKEHKLPRQEVIMVGDELRDIEAARQCGIKIAAVSWGYNSYEALQEAQPDWLLEHPRQLLKL